MILTLLKSKIHRASVTGAELHYEGSITLPRHLIDAANMLPFEQVDILNVNNGARFTTYIIVGEGEDICINGPAARLVQPGDKVIVCAYAQMDEQEARQHTPKVLLMQEGNIYSDA
jgi:aspartate 1-decarboxylase